MARFLGVEQPTVWRLENVREETGPESRLLAALAAGLASGAVAASATPEEALAALGLSPSAPSSPAPTPETTGN